MKRPRLSTAVLAVLAVLPEVPPSKTTGRVRWQRIDNRARKGRSIRRASVGPAEVSISDGWVDFGWGHGTFLAGTFGRGEPARAVAHVRRVRGTRQQTCHVLLNTRPVFLGLLGSNIAEVAVGRRCFLLTWVENDLRHLAPGPSEFTYPDSGKPVMRP